MNLILLTADEEAAAAASDDGVLELPAGDRRARHVVSVLRPEPGATVRVGVLGGGVGRLLVTPLEGGAVRLQRPPGAPRLRELPAAPEPPRVELLLAMPRPKVMMRLWSVLAQLGVRRVVLTNACRVEKPYFASQAVDPAKYGPELQEGLEQAVCTRMPDVRVETRFKPFIEDDLDALCPPGEMLRLLCHPGGEDARLAEVVSAAFRAASSAPASASASSAPASASGSAPARRPRGVLLAVGPEGGWVDFELELLRKHGFRQVTLGTRVLTTDVAVVSLLTLATDALQHQLGRREEEEQDTLSAAAKPQGC